MKKLFILSDVHGFYYEMIEALNKVGFDENNDNHLLISIGDEFDRGPNALNVYRYLKRLYTKRKAIVLKGNHTKFFVDYLKGVSISPFNYTRNGTDETIADFMHQTQPFETWCALSHIDEPTFGDFATWIDIAGKEINEEYPELIDWLESRPYYYETENYIFTHGAIDGLCDDWHYPETKRYGMTGWEACIWDDGAFFGSEIKNTNKTVVIGHFGTSHLRRMYNIEDNGKYDILRREDGSVIAIDATTALSHKVNVLVIEDNLLEE